MPTPYEEIEQSIKENGIAIISIADIGECEQCKLEGKTGTHNHENNLYTEVDDAVVYSIGFHALGLPEIMVLAGPNDGCVMTKEQLLVRLQDAHAFIENIFHSKETFEFNPNMALSAKTEENLYWVMHPSSFKNDELEGIKLDLMPGTVSYYDTTDFELVCFAPHIRNQAE